MKFKKFIELNEVMLTFNKQIHPKFGQVLILAGGAGSGKGFVENNLIGIEGIVLDTDKLKELTKQSFILNSRIKEIYGKSTKDLDFKKPEDVRFMHKVISDMHINDKKIKTVLTSIHSAPKDRKPNIIFDVTLKDMTKFINIIKDTTEMGYSKENINLVWVLNTIDVAQAQNKHRDRIVPEDILLATHQGASYTMSTLIKMGKKLSTYMDGEMYIVFNQIHVDSEVQTSKNGGMYIKKANYVLVKPRYKPVDIKNISTEIIQKIKRYVPDSDIW